MELSLITVFTVISSVGSQSYHSCCTYCRADSKTWITLGDTFQLSDAIEQTKMTDPPAYVVDDEIESPFKQEDRDYKLRYAGAPVQITNRGLSYPDDVLQYQYVQIDMSFPKDVRGIVTQGGFYEEKFQNLYPLQESWVTEFALSSSNDSETFEYYRDQYGAINRFSANSDAVTSELIGFVEPITARYIRYHPLSAASVEGVTDAVNVRITMVTCLEGACNNPRINCLMTQWSAWSSCKCSGGCTHSRQRSVRRLASCGGERCGSEHDSEECVPEEPTWKSAMLYVGIVLGVLLVLLIVALILYKRCTQNNVQVIMVAKADDDDDHVPAPAPQMPAPGGPPPRFRGPGAPMFGGAAKHPFKSRMPAPPPPRPQ